MPAELTGWKSRPLPRRAPLTGRFVRLEPLSAAMHGDDLFAAKSMEGSDERFRWLSDTPPESRAALQPWLEWAEASGDPLFFAVIDVATGRVGGRQAFMRIDAGNGVIEIGHIFWSSLIARRPAATEAFYLFARHAFDDLRYRRLEWKCNNLNEGSKRAAVRFGFTFEGVFRQAAVVKGMNRDTAWFSILDNEWPTIRTRLESWLSPENFASDGQQKRSLSQIGGKIAISP